MAWWLLSLAGLQLSPSRLQLRAEDAVAGAGIYSAPGGSPRAGATGAMHVGGSELARQRVAHAGVTARARRGHVGPPCPPRRTGDGTRGRRGPAGAIGADDETRARGWRLSRPPPRRAT